MSTQLDMLGSITSPSTSLRGLLFASNAHADAAPTSPSSAHPAISITPNFYVRAVVSTGWLPGEACSFVNSIIDHAGRPVEPIILRDHLTGVSTMDRKQNTGTLFRNEHKQNEKQPDYRGYVNVAGLNYEIAGWVNESPKAGKFIRFQLKLKDAAPITTPSAHPNRDFDDPLPL